MSNSFRIVKILKMALINGVKVTGNYNCFFLHVNVMYIICLSLFFTGIYACNRAIIVRSLFARLKARLLRR